MPKVILSEEQLAADHDIDRGRNVLITGQAGTGKSTILNRSKERYGSRLAITASTGIAALNVGGTTIHTFAGLGLGLDPAEVIAGKIVGAKGRCYRNIFRADMLAIDEISMLSSELFDKLNEIFQLVRDNDEPFGGVQLILFGDFLQLPPVSKGGITAGFAFESKAWKAAGIVVHVLEHIYRQKDRPFAEALSRLRVGDIYHPSVELLASRANLQVPDDGIRPVIISTHNEEVSSQNTSELAKLDGEEFAFVASERGQPSGLERLERDCLAPKTLRLKKGAQVMLLSNLDLDTGLANGSLGVVVRIDQGEIAVRFPIAGIVTVQRREFTIQNHGHEIACRIQYPLRLSYALSSHKCQGMTLDRIECHLGRAFEPGMAYVAVSRVKTLDGLFLRKTNRSVFKAHPKAVAFYAGAATDKLVAARTAA